MNLRNLNNSNANNCYKGGSCPKAGIKIHESDNNYTKDPFNNLECNNSFDLNIENYSLEGLYKLFNIQNRILNDEILKESRKFLLKLHPDKSKLDSKFFIFYSKAYKKLVELYEFQNKSDNKKINMNDYSKEYKYTHDFSKENEYDLKKYLESNKIMDEKDPKKFNIWFNEQFDKYGKEVIEKEEGYGNWLSSDDNLMGDIEGLDKKNFNNKFEEQKRKKMELILLNNLNNVDDYGDNDLRKVYCSESIIPVTEDDYNRLNKFKDVNEYKKFRDVQEVNPLNEEESYKILYDEQLESEKQSASLAFKYAKQMEESNKLGSLFWSNIKQIKN